MVLAEASWVITMFKTDVSLGKSQITKSGTSWKGASGSSRRTLPRLGDPGAGCCYRVPLPSAYSGFQLFGMWWLSWDSFSFWMPHC